VKFQSTPVPGAAVVTIEPQRDERGFFARTYGADMFRAAGLPFGTVRQTSISHNKRRGSLRGMHWQAEPKSEGKLVRVTQGRIFDVIIDLRPASPAYLQWFGLELNGQQQDGLLVPPGCAHGFITLDDDSVVTYMMDADFDPVMARGVRWNDPAFQIAWPLRPEVMSERDRTWPDYQPNRVSSS
jgi:dTDP-4-dehydrorhamnose 3,5-epimerase